MGRQYVKKWQDEDSFRDVSGWLSTFSSSDHHRKVASATSTTLVDPDPTPVLPDFDAGNFKSGQAINNPYFPVIRGAVYSYGTATDEPDGDIERNDWFATFESKSVAGVKTHVVRDTAYTNGLLVEDTLDYFAQDRQGNVWYFGEISYNYRYDDDGNYLSTDTNGSWTAGEDGALPGYIMPTREVLEALGNGYLQEFAPGIAEDQADLVSYNATADLDIGFFKDVLQTLDTTQLEPDVREYKKYEPGVGLVQAEELNLDGEVEATVDLLGIRLLKDGGIGRELFRDRCDPDLKDLIEDIDLGDFEQPELRDFRKPGSEVHVTYLGGDTDSNNALGVYTFDLKTGLIDDVEILFPEADELAHGEEFVVELDKGEGYGLFLIPNGADIGLDLSAFDDDAHGLEMRNFLTGKQASIHDRLAPLLIDEESGAVLPIPAFHALDVNTRDDWNLLNPAGGIQAVELEPDELEDGPWDDKVEVLGFEDMFATDPLFDGDFDDLVVAVSRTTLPPALVADLTDDLNLAAVSL